VTIVLPAYLLTGAKQMANQVRVSHNVLLWKLWQDEQTCKRGSRKHPILQLLYHRSGKHSLTPSRTYYAPEAAWYVILDTQTVCGLYVAGVHFGRSGDGRPAYNSLSANVHRPM
jgi:hypothetical protein